MNDGDRAVLKALGIKTGVTYTVVPVGCTQKECIYNSDCQDNAVGLTCEDVGCFMVCHDYKKSLCGKESDKKVYWRRKQDCQQSPSRLGEGIVVPKAPVGSGSENLRKEEGDRQ